MTRTYIRKFSWEEAHRLRAEGLTYKEIAGRFGVCAQAVMLACNDEARAAHYRRSRERQRTGGTCLDCGITISHNPTYPAKRCRACAGKARAKITATEAWCSSCRRWLAHAQFAPSRVRNPSRECRECDTKRKADYRARTQEGWNEATGSTQTQRLMLESSPYEVRDEW